MKKLLLMVIVGLSLFSVNCTKSATVHPREALELNGERYQGTMVNGVIKIYKRGTYSLIKTNGKVFEIENGAIARKADITIYLKSGSAFEFNAPVITNSVGNLFYIAGKNRRYTRFDYANIKNVKVTVPDVGKTVVAVTLSTTLLCLLPLLLFL